MYHTESMAGVTWKAMLAAAETNPTIKARTVLNSFRVPEEFFDLSQDRCERNNLIGDPGHQAEIDSMRGELLALMRRTGDPFTEAFENRHDKELVPAVLQKLRAEYQKK